MRLFLAVLVAILGVVLGLSPVIHHHSTRIVTGSKSTVSQRATQTVYIRNLAPRYISDREIERSIPSWEKAINVDFAKYWLTTQYKLVFIGKQQAPFGAIVATFVKNGPVRGALAYHTVRNGAPAIIVYAGTGDYYGYDNSVSFTHELEELAADPVTANVIQGWPYDYIWQEEPNGSIKASFQVGIYGWFGEVSDPVESDYYLINGVRISDFITPAWFNAGGGARYDFMGLCQQPFWIRPGGYAQFLSSDGWQLIANWRKGHPTDRGFWLADDGR